MVDSGLIFNIQKFSLNDGDGIRTIIFFKGCPLRCQWCSNPESQDVGPQPLFTVDKCIGCKRCEESCNAGARAGGQWDRSRCVLCGRCAEACPSGAIEMIGKEMSIKEIIDEIEKDREFYETSGGGVTLSGGEPLLQWEFASNLVKELKRKFFHVAIETSGYAPWEYLYAVVKDCDMILYDIKHMDSKLHKKYVGVPNEMILDNARRLAASGLNVIFRIPLMGGINDDVKNILETAEYARSLGVKEVDLLPYHRFGESKYRKLDMEYSCTAHTPSDERVRELKDLIESMGLKVMIGG